MYLIYVDESGTPDIKDSENFVLGAVIINEDRWFETDKRVNDLKEDTAEHYRQQQNIYNFLLRKNGYETEDYFFLLFYVPKEVMATGGIIFDTTLVKMEVDVKTAEKIWKDALKMLNSDCPSKSCEWCVGR